MSIFRSCAAIFLVVLSVSFSALAQAAPARSVLINTSAFYDEKGGIAKLIEAEKKVDATFAKDIKSIQEDNAKLTAIAAELEKQPVTEINQKAMLAKKEEGESLQRSLAFRKTDVEAKITKLREELVGPITFDIGKAISEFGKKNGYGSIYDATKLVEAGALLWAADSMDITKDFIAFYNARAASVPIAK